MIRQWVDGMGTHIFQTNPSLVYWLPKNLIEVIWFLGETANCSGWSHLKTTTRECESQPWHDNHLDARLLKRTELNPSKSSRCVRVPLKFARIWAHDLSCEIRVALKSNAIMFSTKNIKLPLWVVYGPLYIYIYILFSDTPRSETPPGSSHTLRFWVPLRSMPLSTWALRLSPRLCWKWQRHTCQA